jgi:hypothetical protein
MARNKPAINEEPQLIRHPAGLGEVRSLDDIQADTLAGDVRDLILQEMRNEKKLPWTERPQRDQEDLIARVTTFAQNIVSRVLTTVNTEGNEHIRVMTDGFQVKDGTLKIGLKSPAMRDSIMLVANAPEHVLYLVFTPSGAFGGERSAIRAVPDQGSLVYGGADDGQADDKPVFDRSRTGERVDA